MTSALADPAKSPGEQVTVQEDSPYTVRQQVIERGNASQMEVRQTSVSKGGPIPILICRKTQTSKF
jgi:hypothetical protein